MNSATADENPRAGSVAGGSGASGGQQGWQPLGRARLLVRCRIHRRWHLQADRCPECDAALALLHLSRRARVHAPASSPGAKT